MAPARPRTQLTGLGYGKQLTNSELDVGQLYAALSETSCTGKAIALYHDRSGDEKSMLEMEIDVDKCFLHIVDTQFMAHDACNNLYDQKPGLARVAADLGYAMTKQDEVQDEYRGPAPIHHNAQDDAYVTLGIAVELLKLHAEQNNLPFPPKGGNANLVSIDFEGAGYYGVSEVGVASISMDMLRAVHTRGCSAYFRTSHVVIKENMNNHPCRGALQRMGLDSDNYSTYPRWNTRSGPSITKKVKRSFAKKDGGHQYVRMSPDTLVLPRSEAKQWFAKLIAAAPAGITATASTTSISGTQIQKVDTLTPVHSAHAQAHSSQALKPTSAPRTNHKAHNKSRGNTGATSRAPKSAWVDWEM